MWLVRENLEADGSSFPVQLTVAKVQYEIQWVFLVFSILHGARARTLQQFCTFCFHNLHRNPCKVLKDYALREILGCESRFPEKQKKSGRKTHQKRKEKSGEFPKSVRPTQKKHTRNLKKAPTFFGKNSNVFQEISYVFSGTSEILSQSEKSDFGRRGVKVVKAKKCKIPGKARVSHAREEKPQWRAAKWNKKRPSVSSHIARALPS